MKNFSIFFRIFDIAFLAPGIVLLCALAAAGVPLDTTLAGTSGTLAAVVRGIWLLTAAYTLGLAIHGLTRLIGWVIDKQRRKTEENGKEPATKWYSPGSPFASGDDHSIALYFWYLRATCWNLAAAVVLSGCIVSYASGRLWLPLAALGAGALLWFAGCEFDRSFRTATASPPANETGAAAADAPAAPSNAVPIKPCDPPAPARPRIQWCSCALTVLVAAALGGVLGRGKRSGNR